MSLSPARVFGVENEGRRGVEHYEHVVDVVEQKTNGILEERRMEYLQQVQAKAQRVAENEH